MIANALKQLLICLILNISIGQAFSNQMPHISHFKKGSSQLTSSTIYRITSDPYGYLWLATNEGLFIFNSSDFKRFYTPANDIEFVAATRIDSLWYCFTYAGEVVEVDLINRKSKLLNYIGSDNKMIRPKINAFRFKDKILISNNSLQLFEIVADSIGQSVGYIKYQGKKPTINEIYNLSETEKQFYAKPIEDLYYASQSLHRISDKELILKNELYTTQVTNKKASLIPRLDFRKESGQLYLTDYAEIKDGLLAGFINGGGLRLYNKNIVSKNIDNGEIILPDVNITDIENQNTEKIWVATSDNGLYLLDYSMTSDISLNSKIGNQKDVTFVSFFSDSLFVGNRRGEIQIITKNSIKKHQLSTPNIYNEVHGIFKVLGDKYLIISKDAIALSDGNRKLWERPAESHKFNKDCTEDETHIYLSQREFCTIISKSDLTSKEVKLSHNATTISPGINGKLFQGGPEGLYINDDEFKRLGPIRVYRLRNWRNLVVMCTNKGVFYLDLNGNLTKTSTSPEVIGELVKRAFVDESQNLYLLSDEGFFFSNTLGEYIPLLLFGNNNAIHTIRHATFKGEYCYIQTNQGLYQLKKPSSDETYLSSGLFSRIVANNHFGVSPRENVKRTRFNNASYFFYSLEVIDFNGRDGQVVWELTDNRTSKVLQREKIGKEQPFVPFKLRPGDYKITAQLFVGGKTPISKTDYSLSITPLIWQRPLFILVILILGIIILYWVLKQILFQLARRQVRKYQKEHDLAFLRQSVQISRMKPHFLFNSFNPIQAFILQGKKMEALEYISSLTKMLRTSMNLFEKEFVTLQEELSFLQNYLQVEDVKNEGAYEYRITIDETIDLSKVYVPTMMLQPLVENAIIHARTDGKPVNIALNIQQHHQQLIITVSDNGPGFTNAIHQDPGHALDLVKKRILLIRKLYAVGQIDFWNQNGAIIKIVLPVLNSRPI